MQVFADLVRGHEVAGWVAIKINPDLALALILKCGEPCASITHADLVRLEDSLVYTMEAQNFTFLVLGCLLPSVPVSTATTRLPGYGRSTLQKYPEGLGGPGP